MIFKRSWMFADCSWFNHSEISDFTHGQRWQFGYGQRTREGIQCWSCQQGSYPGNNFGPEECQKYGKWIQCGPDEVNLWTERVHSHGPSFFCFALPVEIGTIFHFRCRTYVYPISGIIGYKIRVVKNGQEKNSKSQN